MKISLTAVILFFFASLFAQTYVDIPWNPGTVTMDGKDTEGMIRLGGGQQAPWLNHEKVYFVKKADWVEGKRPKKKIIEEYLADEIEGYKTFLMADSGDKINMEFESFEIMIMGSLQKKAGMAFLKLQKQGKVNAYSYVPKPAKKLVSTADERANDNAAAIHQTDVYLSKGGDHSVEKAAECELTKLFSDCPSVVDKIKNEEFGFKPLSERPKKKGLGKMMQNAVGDNKLEIQILEAVKEYNECE